MSENKNHWYDGLFYDKFIAPNLDVTFVKMMRMIEPGTSIIDIGCGSGRFVFKNAERVNKAVGVDLSIRNINLANRLKVKSGFSNIEFIHGNALQLSETIKTKFDYATVSYMIHEIDISMRIDLLKELSKISGNIIIADYLIPQPNNYRGVLNQVVEFFAGPDHFKNFLSFKKNGGTDALVNKAGLKIIDRIIDSTGTSLIVKIN